MIVGVDPGMSGGVAAWANDKTYVQRFTTEAELLELVESFDRSASIVIEDLPRFVPGNTSPSSWFKVGYNYGFEVGVFRAFRFPLTLAKPRTWQKGIPGLKPKMGYTDRKRLLKDAALRLYPKVYGFDGEPAAVTNAVADAILIMDWGRGRSE